jgi:hypothetical protein
MDNYFTWDAILSLSIVGVTMFYVGKWAYDAMFKDLDNMGE